METLQPKKSAIAARYGIIAGLLIVIYSLVLIFSDLYFNKKLGWVANLFVVGAIIFAYRDYKSQNQGFMSYGQGLGIGTLTAIVSGVLAGIFNYIYFKFIDPTMLTKMGEMQRIEMEGQGLSEEQIEAGMKMGAMFSSPEMIFVMSVLGHLFIGFLISLVVAAAMRNARPEFE